MRKLIVSLAVSLSLISPGYAINNPFAQSVQGDTSAGSTDAGRPVKTGAVARTTNTGAASDGQRVNNIADKRGRPIVVLNNARGLEVHQNTTITASTSETTIFTANATQFLDITTLVVTNSSTTGTLITLKDSTAGTTQGIYYVPANGGIVISFPTPLTQGAVNNNWTITCGTSVSSIYVVVTGILNI